MNATSLSLNSLKRITVIDALRGFALFGIILMHMVEQYFGNEVPFDKLSNGIHPLLDHIVYDFVSVFVQAKFFTIFSFLFGLSFFIQMDRAHQKGLNFKGRFCWRLLILMVIGYVHGLFYMGDILIVYAILGFVLILFYNLKDKVIIIAIVILISGVPRLAITGYQQAFLPAPTKAQVEVQKEERKKTLDRYYNTLKTGSVMDVIKMNSFENFMGKLNFQFSTYGRGYQTLALFLMGLLLGRKRFFENIVEYKVKTKRVLIGLSIVAGSIIHLYVVAILIASLTRYGQTINQASPWLKAVGFIFYDTFNLAVTGIYITAFVLLYQKAKAHRVISKLAPIGRMGLTTYVGQSLIGVLIFYGFGFGLIDTFGASVCALLAIGVFFFQILISKWWLSYFNYGPLEWFWRSATYLKMQPFKKKQIVTI